MKIVARGFCSELCLELMPAKFQYDPMKTVGSIRDWSLKNDLIREIAIEIRACNKITHDHQPSTCDNFGQDQYFLKWCKKQLIDLIVLCQNSL